MDVKSQISGFTEASGFQLSNEESNFEDEKSSNTQISKIHPKMLSGFGQLKEN